MRARLVLALAVAALSAAGGAAASASTLAPPPIISITTGPDGVCVTVSLQTTHCVPVSALASVDGTTQTVPVGLPYRKGDEVCYDPTPTSKGPCVPVGSAATAR